MRSPALPGTSGLLPSLLIALVLVFAACGDGGPSPRPTPDSGPPDGRSPENGSPVAGPTKIGTFDDESGFLEFGGEVDDALERRDVSFFVENVALEDVSCDVDLPAPPESCEGAQAGTSVPAVLLSEWEAEDVYLDSEGYREFMMEFLNEYAEGESDSYGDAAPRLYAYSIIAAGVRSSPADGETVEAIVTRIARTGARAEREALLITSGFDGERWTIRHLTKGPATFLEPTGPQGADDGGVFDFWSRWED